MQPTNIFQSATERKNTFITIPFFFVFTFYQEFYISSSKTMGNTVASNKQHNLVIYKITSLETKNGLGMRKGQMKTNHISKVK